LKLTYDGLLSNFAFKFHLRRYVKYKYLVNADGLGTSGRFEELLALGYGRPDVACHGIQRILNPRFLSQAASYDLASNIGPALCGIVPSDYRSRLSLTPGS